MAKYLVVAHETVTNPKLIDQLRAIQKDDAQAEFVLLVPATPVRHLLRRVGEHDAEVVAGKLADKARSMFAKKGVHVGRYPSRRCFTGRRGRRRAAGQPRVRRGGHLHLAEGEVPVAADGPAAHRRIAASPAGLPRAGTARVVSRRLALTSRRYGFGSLHEKDIERAGSVHSLDADEFDVAGRAGSRDEGQRS